MAVEDTLSLQDFFFLWYAQPEQQQRKKQILFTIDQLQHRTMNTFSAQTTPGQEDTASESDKTWSQQSDIHSLRSAEFECVSLRDSDEDDDDNEEEDQKKGGGKKPSIIYKLNEWKFVCDEKEKHSILVDRFTKFKFDFQVPNGNVCRCKFHIDCPFKIKIVAPNASKKSVIYVKINSKIFFKQLMTEWPTCNMSQRPSWRCTRPVLTPTQ
jgi:hypothetical protein